MANRNYPQARVWGMHLFPVSLDMSVSIGASGVPTIESGSGLGIKAITKMDDGQYRIQLQDNYFKLLGVQVTMQSPVSGGSITAGSFSTGTVYQITALGNTTQAQWVTAGVPSGITAAVGVVFKAAAAGAGTGTAKVLGSSGVACVELMGNSVNMLQNSSTQPQEGGFVDIQTLDDSLAAVEPTSGSKMYISLKLSNSSV